MSKGEEKLMPNESTKMEILDYRTASGKDVIFEYINSLPKKERAEGIRIRHVISKKTKLKNSRWKKQLKELRKLA